MQKKKGYLCGKRLELPAKNRVVNDGHLKKPKGGRETRSHREGSKLQVSVCNIVYNAVLEAFKPRWGNWSVSCYLTSWVLAPVTTVTPST